MKRQWPSAVAVVGKLWDRVCSSPQGRCQDPEFTNQDMEGASESLLNQSRPQVGLQNGNCQASLGCLGSSGGAWENERGMCLVDFRDDMESE